MRYHGIIYDEIIVFSEDAYKLAESQEWEA